MRHRFRLIGLLLVGLAGCGGASPPTPPATVLAAQASPAATSAPASPVATTATPSPTSAPTPQPTAAPPMDVPALLETTPPVTFTVRTAAADAAFQQLPADVLLVNTGESDRRLILVDSAGKQLVSPTDDLERLGWCESFRDAYSPSGSWSSSGRYLLVWCQGANFYPSAAMLDLEHGEWIDLRPDPRPRFHNAATDEYTLSGDDEFSFGTWLVPDEQILFSHHQTLYNESGGERSRTSSTYVFSVHDRTLSRIADFDGSDFYSYVVSPDRQQIAIVARRAGDPGNIVYVWQGGSTLRRLSLDGAALDAPGWQPDGRTLYTQRALPIGKELYRHQYIAVDVTTGAIRVLAESNDYQFRTLISPDSNHFALGDETGWRVYQADGTEIASFPISTSISANQAAVWSADGAALLICQVEADVGASVVRLDLQGATEILHSYPNVGFAYKACVSESLSGLTAISLSNPLVVIVDPQQAEIGSVKGQSFGWRPSK